VTLRVSVAAGHKPEAIVISATSGSISVDVVEDARYARTFWSELGRVLDEIHHEDGGHEVGSP
jgi:NADH:ubiquinone oxidoreductase subunit D